MTPAAKRFVSPATRFAVFGSIALLENALRKPIGKAISAANGRNVMATSNTASPNIQTKLSPGDGLTPVGAEIPRQNARPQGRPETRHCPTIRLIRCALTFQKGFFFAKNQAINKNPVRQHQKNKSGTACQDADSGRHWQVCQVKRIARVAKRSVSYERFRMLRSIVHDFSSQIGRAPGAQRGCEENEQGPK